MVVKVDEDGDLEPPSDEIRKYQEHIKQRATEKKLKEHRERFRQKIIETRAWDERDKAWVFSEFAPQKAPGKDNKGAPQYDKGEIMKTGELGKDRYLEQLRRWNEAHTAPNVNTVSVRHIMRVDDRIQAIRGKDYQTKKEKAKKA